MAPPTGGFGIPVWHRASSCPGNSLRKSQTNSNVRVRVCRMVSEKNRDANMGALAPDVGSAISAGRRKVTWRCTSGSFDVVAFLQPGCSASMTWLCRRGEGRAVDRRRGYEKPEFVIPAGAGEGSAVAVDEVVNLRSTKTSLAGIRRCVECPGCHRRSRIRTGLVSAAGSAMAVGRNRIQSRAQRANRRARKIRRRLGGSECLLDEFPSEPRGMHRGLSSLRSSGGCCGLSMDGGGRCALWTL